MRFTPLPDRRTTRCRPAPVRSAEMAPTRSVSTIEGRVRIMVALALGYEALSTDICKAACTAYFNLSFDHYVVPEFS